MKSANHIILAHRYAKSLMNIASAENLIEDINKNLNFLKQVINENEKFLLFLSDLSVATIEKKNLCVKLFNKVDMLGVVVNTIFLLIDRNKAEILPDIIKSYYTYYLEEKNIIEVNVQSKTELKDNQKEIILNYLNKILERKPDIKYVIDSDMKGGIVIKYQDKVIDGSLDTILTNLEKKFIY